MAGMDMRKLMKQMQQAQQAASQIQEELAGQTVEGGAGGGMVSIVMNGHGKLQSLKIKPEAIDPSDPEALEDLLMAAFSDAEGKAEALQQDATRGLLPPGF